MGAELRTGGVSTESAAIARSIAWTARDGCSRTLARPRSYPPPIAAPAPAPIYSDRRGRARATCGSRPTASASARPTSRPCRRTLPPSALLDARKIEGGPPGPAEDFVQIGDLLRETDASPALRAAIYKVAATIPGVELLGPARDHAGRLGIGLAYKTAGARSELIFDPYTSALLGELDTDTSGRLTGWAVYLQSRIVNGLPGRAPGPLRPACVNYSGRAIQERDGSTLMVGP